LDGFALLRRFQEIDALQGVPVVAVTGYGLASDKVRSAEAVKAAEQDCPQLTLLDLQLPDMTGIGLKELIQLLPGCQSCVFLALTGSDEAEDIDSTVRAGFLAHLMKPVSFDRLLLEVERVAMVTL
jgi:CheY-like chemotaxis protein